PVPGRPLVLPNVWDVPSAHAVVAAGFPVVATSSGAVAATLGYEDHHGAPADEMLAAAAAAVQGGRQPGAAAAGGRPRWGPRSGTSALPGATSRTLTTPPAGSAIPPSTPSGSRR